MRNRRHRFEIGATVTVGLLFAIAQRYFDKTVNDFFTWDLAPVFLIGGLLAFLAVYWAFIEPKLGPSDYEWERAVDTLITWRWLDTNKSGGLSEESLLYEGAEENFRAELYRKLELGKPRRCGDQRPARERCSPSDLEKSTR